MYWSVLVLQRRERHGTCAKVNGYKPLHDKKCSTPPNSIGASFHVQSLPTWIKEEPNQNEQGAYAWGAFRARDGRVL